MQKPYVEYNYDEIVLDFIQIVAGTSAQDLMIGCELLFGAGLATRELALVGRKLTVKFTATPDLEKRYDLLTDTPAAGTF